MKFMHVILPLTLFLHACGGGGSSSDSPTILPPLTNPTAGTVLEEACNGTTLVQTIADGNGGSTEEQQENSEQCGYEPPPAFGTPISDPYCANNTEQQFLDLLDTIQNLKDFDKVQDFADGEGGSYIEIVETDSEDCGWTAVPEQGTLIGESYCANNLNSEEWEIQYENIHHLLGEDRLQDYADGEGGTYTERTIHIDQTCFVAMEPPEECPTTASSTGDSRYEYLTCDGIKQRSDVSFPYEEGNSERAVIDMLIVFDTNITEEERDGMTVEDFVDKQIFEANHMYMVSGTFTLLRVAGIKMVDVAKGDLYRQYSAFFNGRYEFNGLDAWQRDSDADLAFLFKKRPEAPIACGVASLDATRGITKTRGITQCYHNSVFQETATTRYYNRAHETFAHEVGHLLGLEHEWEDANSVPIFEFGYGYHLPGYRPQKDNPDYEGTYSGYGTIMTYADFATGRFSDRSVTCNFPEEAGEYAGRSVTLGTDGGCFCLDPVETQQPPTDSVDQIRRVRYLMSQLHEREHGVQFSPVTGKMVPQDDPVWMIWTNAPKDICFF